LRKLLPLFLVVLALIPIITVNPVAADGFVSNTYRSSDGDPASTASCDGLSLTCVILGVPVTSGQLVMVSTRSREGANPTISDTAGNTYTTRADVIPQHRLAVDSTIAGTTATIDITATFSVNQYAQMDATVYSGFTSFRNSASGSGGGINSPGSSLLTVTGTQAGGILYEVWSYMTGAMGSATCVTSILNSGQTLDRLFPSISVPGSGGCFHGLTLHKTLTGGGTQELDVGWTGGSDPSGNNDDMAHWAVELSGFALPGPPGNVNQCYGNCDALTTGTSSTNINFNNSLTVFYPVQSALNGFIANVTTHVAQTYTNGLVLFLGLYTTDRQCTVAGQPFTTQCPGFLLQSAQFANPAKGAVMMTTNIVTVSGQWFGVAVSASFGPLALNDTNTAAVMYQTSGVMPGLINQFSSLGNRNISLRAHIIGTTGGTSPPGAEICTTIPCGLIALAAALGGGVFGALFAFIIIFSITLGMFLYFTALRNREGFVYKFAFPESMFAILMIIFLLSFSAIGILPVWVPVLIIVIVSWLFAETIWSRRR